MIINRPDAPAVPAKAYIAAWNRLRHASPAELRADVPSRQWRWHPVPAWEVLSDMRAALDRRINRHDLQYGKGRKWDWNWQAECGRMAWKANNNILMRPNDVMPEYRTRLAKRITNPWEE